MSNNPLIHPTAIIDASAVIAADVEIGPYCIIGPKVSIGAGTHLLPLWIGWAIQTRSSHPLLDMSMETRLPTYI